MNLLMENEMEWRQQVSSSLVYLIQTVQELKMENDALRRQLNEQQHYSIIAGAVDEKLLFNAVYVEEHKINDFDPLNPERTISLGEIVADFANGHNFNGCSLGQVVQPITTGVIRKLFESEADKYTYTEDSVGKGRPARYAKIPTEFIKELSEAICDGFNPSKTQRAQLLPQARTIAGTVARNYFNNARSHRKKSQNSASCSVDDDKDVRMDDV
ncbi:unnamed protein product [Bursaphelenchus xylophilus]|uniref:(pine wood nematode) hypothetical protein n=1 Tax=Bursaphelenchus xylophilus TaxID=6326 RepID=A0A1I7SSE0_BURXY|nr:unnamed protein product [Bursaphelenchus xylophilus]CAG9097671.1 unnamed protein product [Bursaphelenchus xylophilus]